MSVAPTSLTVYTVAEQEQYVNNQDDRTRGQGNNPFGNFVDQAPAQVKSANGPFPGDEAIFSFNVYSDPSLQTRAGSATFVCQYNFMKNAFCDASLQLDHRGNLTLAGAFNFDAMNFTLGVTGGTGAYLNKKGVVRESPSANHAQKLNFEFE